MYEGEWVNGYPTGKGILVRKGGAIYEGGFIKNQKNGKGLMKNLSNGVQFVGEWKRDLIVGEGILILENGKEVEVEIEDHK